MAVTSTTLGQACTLKAGKFIAANDITDEYRDGLYPCYGGNGIRGYVPEHSHEGTYPLIGRQGALCGNVNFASGKFRATEHAVVVQPNVQMNIRWLYYKLLSMNLGQYATGAAQPGLAVAKLEQLPFAMPSLEEQERLSILCDHVESLISIRKQQLAKLDELVKARFVEMFGDLHSTNFPKCKMADICDIKHGYAFSGEFFTEEDNNILLVTPGNFKVGGGFQEKRCKFFKGEYPEEYTLNSGDLIVTMTDLSKNMDTLGYSAIVPCTERIYLHNQRIGLFINMSENINRVFLMYFMQTNEYRDRIIASATGSTVHHTSPSKILDCDIFVPPLELQRQFAAFVAQTDKQKLTIQQSLDKLELMKKALMQKYFG